MNLIVVSLIILGVIGLLSAIILYFVAQKFKVYEDPRIGLVEEVLPGANCGGCGYPGCHGFAEACAKAESLDGLLCPVGGNEVMSRAGEILGMAVAAAEPMVAVLRCNGGCANRARTSKYDGAKSCRIAHNLYSGETECSFGCVGFGDCEAVCKFDALHINQTTGLPEIDEDKCTACGACVKDCPKAILELRKKGVKSRRIWVACANKDKGGAARKACSVACIGCGKCAKVCTFDAITLENNLAYIDFNKCRLCRKCGAECPTGAISELNFPPRPQVQKPVVEKPVAEKKEEAKLVVEEIVERKDIVVDIVSENTVREEIVILEEPVLAKEEQTVVETVEVSDLKEGEVTDSENQEPKPKPIDAVSQKLDF